MIGPLLRGEEWARRGRSGEMVLLFSGPLTGSVPHGGVAARLRGRLIGIRGSHEADGVRNPGRGLGDSGDVRPGTAFDMNVAM